MASEWWVERFEEENSTEAAIKVFNYGNLLCTGRSIKNMKTEEYPNCLHWEDERNPGKWSELVLQNGL